MQFHNPLPYTAFERRAAELATVTPSLLRFTLCFFASLPLNYGLSHLRNPTGACERTCRPLSTYVVASRALDLLCCLLS